MYIKVCIEKNPHQSVLQKSLFLDPDSKFQIMEQHVYSLKIASVTPNLKDNLMQIHILIINILQMSRFISYHLLRFVRKNMYA